MTVTLATEKNDTIMVACEYEHSYYYDYYVAKVYEKWGGEWHQTHESKTYSLKEDAMRSYKRFIRKYIE